MKFFRIFIMVALSAAVCAGCDDKIEEPPFSVDFGIDDSKIVDGDLVITDAVYNNNVILSANTNDWNVDVTQTGSWLTVTKLSEGNSHRVNIKAEENTDFDVREADVSFKYQGQQVGKFKVKQLGSGVVFEVSEDDLTQNLTFEEVEFDVVLRTNITGYTVSYEYDPEVASDWIEQIEDEENDALGKAGNGTRAVESASETLRFKAGVNCFDTRSGKIVLTYGDIIRKVTVNQLGETPDILVDETAVTLLYNDTSLEIEVTANVDYNVDVEYTDGSGWLTKAPKSRALVDETVKFTVSENEMAEPRSAKVVFTYKDTERNIDIRREVPVTQNGFTVMSVVDPASGSLTLPFASSTFTIKVASNTAIAPAATPPAWITQQGDPTLANGIYTYTFSYYDNNGMNPLTGKITFTVYLDSVEVNVTQVIGAIYLDQISVNGATVTQATGSTRTDVYYMYNGDITDNYDSSYTADGQPVTLTFELEDGAPRLSKIVYYRKGNGDGNAFSMTGFELLTSDTADGVYTSRGTFTVSPAPGRGEPYEIILPEPIANPKYVRMIATVPENGWFTCAEMQFFATLMQNDEFVRVTSTPLPSGNIENGNYIPAAGGSYDMAVSANVDYTFECSPGVTVTAKPGTRALPERSTKEWTITVGEGGPLWKALYVKIKKQDGTVVQTLTANQALANSKITVYPDSSSSGIGVNYLTDLNFTNLWESRWGSGGYGATYDTADNPVRPESPISISFSPGESVASVSGMTLYPRNGNGDWNAFHVVVKTAANPEGTTVYTHSAERIAAKRYFSFPKTENPTEIVIYINGTSSKSTASMNEIVLWE